MHTRERGAGLSRGRRTELAQSEHELSHKSEQNELKNEQIRQTDRPTFGIKTWNIKRTDGSKARSGKAGVSVPGLQQLQSSLKLGRRWPYGSTPSTMLGQEGRVPGACTGETGDLMLSLRSTEVWDLGSIFRTN